MVINLIDYKKESKIAIKRIQFDIFDEDKVERRKLIGFSFGNNKKDLYFYDKSYKPIKLSFHKDGSVWFHEDDKKDKIYDAIKGKGLDAEKLFNYILYFPCNYLKYEKSNIKKIKTKVAHYYIERPLSMLFRTGIRCFFSSFSMDYNDIKSSFDIKNEFPYKINAVKDDKTIIQGTFTNPIFRYENFYLYLDVVKIERPEEIKEKRIIFLTPPNKGIDVGSFKEAGSDLFNINLNRIKKGSILRDTFLVSGVEVLRLIY